MAETIRIEIPIETVDNTEPELSKINKKLKEMENIAKQAQSSVSKTTENVSKFDRSSQKTQKTLSNWMKQKYQILLEAKDKIPSTISKTKRELSAWLKQKYQLLLEAKDKISPILPTLKSGLKTITNKTWKVTMKAVDMVTAPVRGILNLLKNPIFQVGAVLGVTIGLADTINTFADFEASISNVKAISGATRQEMELLTAKAKEMGASTSKTAKDAADALGYMALAGWNTETMLKSIYPTLRLSEAGNIDLGRTSDLVTDSMSSLGIGADELQGYLDKVAKTAASSNTDIDALMEAFLECGGTVNRLKMPLSEASSLLGALANRGVKGSEAGIALNSILINLTAVSGQAAKAMKELGLSAYDSNHNFRGYAVVLEDLYNKIKDMDDEKQNYYLSSIGMKTRINDLQKLLMGISGEYEELKEKVEDSDGALERMARTMQDNLKGSITRFQSALEGVKLTLGEELEPYLRDFVDWLTSKMPLAEDTILITVGKIKNKVAELKETIAEFTATEEWKNADFFGKVKIAWDKIIAEPFSEWWNSTGKGMFANIARSMGQGIGSGISTGLLTLLGIKVEDGIEDGVSIGKSFAEGFLSGFDMEGVKDKFGGFIQGIFSSAAKILPGGEKANFSSFLSAMLIGKMASPFIGIGKKLFGKGNSGTSLVGSLLGKATIDVGLDGGTVAGGSGLLGLLGKAGLALNSGATTGGGLALAGGVGIAGGVAGGLSAVSGVIDGYKALKSLKSNNKEEAKAYGTSAGLKIGGAGAGAAIGTLILPGLGTAIGAGIGGIAGYIAGNHVKKNYEEEQKAAEMAKEQARIIKEQAKYDSMELKAAIADTSITAEEFGYLFQKAVGKDLQKRFGDIQLSMVEIQDMAKKIVFDQSIESANDFAEAVRFAESSFSSLESSMQGIKKLNWKASLGITWEQNELETYKSSMEELMANAKTYVEDKHYEATTAIKLLVNGDSDYDFTFLNETYADIKQEVEEASNDLAVKVNLALEDGTITIEEQEIIEQAQQKLMDITEKLSNAKTEASFQAIKIKYSAGELDVNSYSQLIQETKAKTEELKQQYDAALEEGLTYLELANPEDKEQQIEELKIRYSTNLDELQARVENLPLNTLVDRFSEELEGILPGIEGTAAEKLDTVLRSVLASGIDLQTLDTETFSKIIGIDHLSEEVKTNIIDMLKQTADLISSTDTGLGKGIESSLLKEVKQTDYETVMDTIKTVFNVPTTYDFSEGANGIMKSFAETLEETDMGAVIGAVNAIKLNTQRLIDVGFEEGFKTSTKVNVEMEARYSLKNPLPSIPKLWETSSSIPIAKNAKGNMIYNPTLSLVGEDGAEAIIPLTSKYRSRGLSLWEQAGEALGVKKYAKGGLIGVGSRHTEINPREYPFPVIPASIAENRTTNDVPISEPISSVIAPQTANSTIQVNVQMSPEFTIHSSGKQSEEDIMAIIRKNLKAMADELGGEIAERLEAVFSNMPLKKEA